MIVSWLAICLGIAALGIVAVALVFFVVFALVRSGNRKSDGLK
jgi:hypothetical protein